MAGHWELEHGSVGELRCYVAGDEGSRTAPSDSSLVLCHELPLMEGGSSDAGRAYPGLADRIAQESGWKVIVPMLRGVGGSEGDFTASGWLGDLHLAIHNETNSGERIALAGFDIGGLLALRLALDDDRVIGVACLGAPVDLVRWSRDPTWLVAACRRSGVIRHAAFPDDVGTWLAEISDLAPGDAASRLQGRSLLVVHGADDPDVPLQEVEELAITAKTRTDLRIIAGAGHRLRADPRAVATLIGWLERLH